MKLIPFNQQLSSPSLALCSLVRFFLSLVQFMLLRFPLSCMTLTIFGNCIDPFPFRQLLRGSLNYNSDSRLHCNNSSAQAEPSRGSAAAAFLSLSRLHQLRCRRRSRLRLWRFGATSAAAAPAEQLSLFSALLAVGSCVRQSQRQSKNENNNTNNNNYNNHNP